MNVLIVLAAIALAGGGASTSAPPTSRHFVPNSRVILFGDVLDQVPSDDGESLGTLIERTEDGVLINGRVWVPKFPKPKEPIRTPQYIEAERWGAIIEEAARQFRAQHKKVDSGRFTVGNEAYSAAPRPFHVEKYDETVDLAVKPGIGMDYIYVTYEGNTAGMPLYPLPTPSKEEQAERRLDGAFQTAVNAQPGTILFISRGHFMSYPLEKADALLAAMGKVPSLAVPVAEDIYGDMAYRSLKVDGFFFDPQVVAVIMRREGRRER